MESDNIDLCYGCLCPDRKTSQLSDPDKKQCFLQITSELSISVQENKSIQLCWECEAKINNFIKFKLEVRASFMVLKKYLNENATAEFPLWKPRLSIHNINTISIPEIDNTELIDNIKQENIDHDDYQEEPYQENLDIAIDKKVTKKKIKKRRRKRTKCMKEVYLNREQIEKERNKTRAREEYVNSVFKCELCILAFPNAEDLKDHSSIKHNQELQYKCDVCLCTFNNLISIKYHWNKHSRRYTCPVPKCDMLFNSRIAARRHLDYYHGYGSLLQRFDKNNGDEDEAQINHVKDTTPSSQQSAASFPCEVCNKSFRWKTSLRKHVETHRIESGQKRKPFCETCNLSFSTTANLQKHVKTSSKHQIQLKVIKLSGNPLEADQAVIQQIACTINSSKQLFSCSQCDKKFQWRGNLARHMSSHMARANGDLVCKPCNRTFSSVATYKQHMKNSKKHVSEKDFQYMCIECGKRFSTNTHLKDHTNWEHLKNFVHNCTLCQKVFKSYTSLYLHKQTVHNKDNQEHLCDHCGKPFPNHTKLRAHITALHSDGSAYKCGTCGARFNWHSCLTRHVRKKHNDKTV